MVDTPCLYRIVAYQPIIIHGSCEIRDDVGARNGSTCMSITHENRYCSVRLVTMAYAMKSVSCSSNAYVCHISLLGPPMDRKVESIARCKCDTRVSFVRSTTIRTCFHRRTKANLDIRAQRCIRQFQRTGSVLLDKALSTLCALIQS
jgi:hypothetical protein